MRIAQSYFDRLLYHTDPLEAVCTLTEMWSVRAQHKIPRLGLSHAEYMAHLAIQYDAEVGNGGHLQYFWNSWGDYCKETIDALHQVGLSELSQTLIEAALAWASNIPRSCQLRRQFIDSTSKEVLANWERLDPVVWDHYGGDEKLVAYLRDNADEILVAERSKSA